MGECRDLKGSAVRSVVLGIRLVGASARNREEIARKVLEDPKVRKAIHQAFSKQAGALTGASLTGKALDGQAAKAFLKPVQKAAQPAAVAQVKKQAEYKDAERGLQNLKCAFNKTPVGLFIDDNQTWLIIAGAVLGVGGAVAMYYARAGDLPASGMALLANAAAAKIELGNVTLGVSGVEFKPSNREVKGAVAMEMGKLKLHGVKTRFELKSAVKAGQLQELMASETVVVPLAPSTQLKAKAAVGARENKPAYEMALTVQHKPGSGLTLDVTAYMQGLGPAQTIGGKATAGYRMDTSGLLGPQSMTTLGATGAVQATRPGGASRFQTEGSLTVGLTATFF